MATIPAAEIPTLRLLYKLQRLDPSSNVMSGATSAYNNKIATIRGDITKLAVDAIVNAANRSLLGGGGVDGAIHRAAGSQLLAECRTLGGCATGSSKITNAYNLPCKKVIHTVGPVYSEHHAERCAAALQGCYRSSLQLAAQHGLKTIAFSCISTGVYGYPSRDAATIACSTAKDFLSGEHGSKIDKIIFVTFEGKDVASYDRLLPRFFPPESEATDETQSLEAEATASQLPSVPSTEPSDSEHVQKKQKQEDTT
ncbi:MACRO domain-containing protein [Xylaria bambusicola]|uniref:MACRO domain-containing protein n=1 Tax=Xylaria bambusicola TaxID=326684 RepID=UPI0020074E65|nr:MACRO domain-containing protein [Xylaria bambusicola]KAI0508899.1 MACRO domain-containing protein [Xylaria bambusicola]